MRLVADSGLWSTAPLAAPPTPLVAVLEVSGAVLSWTVDDPSGVAATRITFTDPSRADWLWRVLGESGHVAVASAVEGRAAAEARVIELDGVDLVPGSVDPLRRLAIGHWLRRWWPTSERDAIAGLDGPLLDAEIALLTAAAEDFFADDTLDSDVAGLLEPHPAALIGRVHNGDPRVLQLARACAELADAVGLGAGWSDLSGVLDDSSGHGAAAGDLAPMSGRRDDYALAAGAQVPPPASAPIARGVASINWAAVPPGVFDAAEHTVDWSVEVAGSVAGPVAGPVVVAAVRAAVIGPGVATGIAAHLRSGSVSGTGVLDPDGRAALALVDAQQRPMTESGAWNHDWSATSVTIGADAEESPQTRERIRNFARARLERPASDAYLAEILAAESNY